MPLLTGRAEWKLLVAKDDTPRSVSQGGRYAHWNIEPPVDREEEGWLLTYLDVITLLLVMLVVLLAFSDLKSNPHPVTHHTLDSQPITLEALPASPSEELVTGRIEDEDPLAGLPLDLLGDDVEVLIQDDSIRFRISSEILFPSGQSLFTSQGLALLERLSDVLNATQHRIAIEGHTDDVPIQTARFPSNWELSTGRATSVVRHLERSGVASTRLRATGYADTRPISPNDTPEGRANNRRVELIMETKPLQ